MSYIPAATAKQALRRASCPVEHQFSTRTMGMFFSLRGSASRTPASPVRSVPTQAAWMSPGSIPASW